MLKAVIFDMDGVLVDSEPVHFLANYNMLKENFGIELLYDDYKKYIGSTIEKIWKYFREKYGLYDYDWKTLMDMAEQRLKEMLEIEGYPPVEGASELVRELKNKGYLLAVASSSPMEKIVNNLKNLGISEEFDVLVSGMEIENPKPSPDIFLKAADMLKVEPSQCLVVEDSMNGVNAAKLAGMACLGYINENSGNQDLSKADYLCESLSVLDEAFIRMVHNHTFGLPWTVMETENLIIREIDITDIDELIDMYSEPEMTKYMEGLFERDKELAYIKDYMVHIYGFYGYGMWLVTDKKGNLVGRAGIEFYNDDLPDENEVILKKTLNEKEQENMDGKHLLGYVIRKSLWRNGYGYEAASAVLEYAKKELGIRDVYVKIHKENKASLALAKKLGFS